MNMAHQVLATWRDGPRQTNMDAFRAFLVGRWRSGQPRDVDGVWAVLDAGFSPSVARGAMWLARNVRQP